MAGAVRKAFVLYRESKGLDKATLSEDRYISRRLQQHLGGHMANELGVAEIRSFLDTAKTSDSLEHKLYKVGSLIFAYGKEQRVLVLNPFDEIDRPKVAYTVPEILEAAQFKRLPPCFGALLSYLQPRSKLKTYIDRGALLSRHCDTIAGPRNNQA